MKNFKLAEYIGEDIHRLTDEAMKSMKADSFEKAGLYLTELSSKVKQLKELIPAVSPQKPVVVKPAVVVEIAERTRIKRTIRGIYDLDSSMILYIETLISIFEGHMDADGEHGKVGSRKLWALMCDRLAPINTNRVSIMRTVDRNIFPSLRQEFGLRQGWANDPENNNLSKRAWFFTNKTIEALKATVARLHLKVKAASAQAEAAPAAMGG